MKDKNMTALTSAYVRAYHYKNNKYRVYSDPISLKIITEEEFNKISESMINGITFFNSSFEGNKNEILDYIVNCHISSTVLGRSNYCLKKLKNAYKLGATQYLALATGYDTLIYNYNLDNIIVFELDKEQIIKNKIIRLRKNNIETKNINYLYCDFNSSNWIDKLLDSKYDKNKMSFCSLLGISYYLSEKSFELVFKNLSNVLKDGSSIVFDYQSLLSSKEMQLTSKLAKGCNEEMLSRYSFKALEQMLEKYNFLIYEHLSSSDINNEIFYNYNTLNPNKKIILPNDINFVLVVKKTM